MLRTTLFVTLALAATAALADSRSYKVDNNRLVVPHPVVFDTGKDTLKADSDAAIAYVATYLADKSYVSTMRIEVHSDSMGADEYNQKLTRMRAFAVGKALIAKGVDCKRLIAVGFGASKPVTKNDTPENKAKNRRTEFVHAALRGKAINGAALDGGGGVAGDRGAK